MPAKTEKTTVRKKKKAAAKNGIKQSSINTDMKFWNVIYDENSASDEKLDKNAIIDNDRPYTFRQLFRRWENCAEVFTGLGITEENHSRLAVLMVPGVDSLSVVYGANMIGVSVSAVTELDVMNVDRLIETFKKEEITDVIFDSSFIGPNVLRQIMRRKNECRLNNVILFHLNYKVTKYFGPVEKEMQEINYRRLKKIQGVHDMHALFVKYEATPFRKSTKQDDAAYIVHTSGTTKGIHKPIPLSDKAVNESVRRILDDPTFDKLRGGTIAFSGFLSSAYHMLYEINMPLAAGCTVVFLPFTKPTPAHHRAIKDYNVTILVTAQIMFNTWFYPFRDDRDFDLSSLEYVVLGGEFIPGKKRKELNEFIAEKGGHAKVAVGYGLSEVGGAAILSAPGVEDDTIGYPMIGVKVRIQDETDNKFYDISDGPRSGGLYICSTSNSSGKLGDTKFFETETIDGEDYICTYDRVTVDKNGALTCHGRMNRFFINNEGIKFDAGLIEVSLNGETNIEECAIVPEYNKKLHDTIPVLYVKTNTNGADARRAVERALCNVFVKHSIAKETNLPIKCVICDELPHNQSGKADIYQIINDGWSGDEYVIVAVRVDGAVKDVKVMKGAAAALNPGAVPKEMEEEFRKYTLPFFQNLEQMRFNGIGDKKMKPDFKKILPMMGCNPADYDEDSEELQNPYDAFRKSFRRPDFGCNPNDFDEYFEDFQNPYDAFRKRIRKPEMGCNPANYDDDDLEDLQNPYDGFRKSIRRPQMGCNPSEEDDYDDDAYPRYNQSGFPFMKPRMGCNPFFDEDEDEDDDD